MKRPFLVLYDYGQGGLWAHLIAESENQIRSRHPELVILEARPAWMSAEEESQLETIDIDDVTATWLAVPPDTPGAAAG
jgi:hypothetical protein